MAIALPADLLVKPSARNGSETNGLIAPGYQLSARAIASLMGFPSNWFEGLTQHYSNKKIISSHPIPQEELGQDTSQEEQLLHHKQPSPSAESSISTQLLGGDEHLLEQNRGEHLTESKISIPCLVKQPKQPELRGVIQKDLGDRFLVNIGDEAITVSKLFVYPDFDQSIGTLQGGLNKSSSKNTVKSHQKVSDTSAECSSKIIPPCTKSSSKIRRKKGEGSGYIYYRTVTRNGKEYQQAYYQWRENGKPKTKYIPKKLLDKVEEAEYKKYPVTEILELLQGGLNKCSSNCSSTSSENVLAKNESIETTANCSSKNTSPPCTKRKRPSGYGGGYIEYREVKRNHKVYAQYWYHWEIWRSGVRLTKKSRYIPKRLLSRVEKMEGSKVAVREILEVLTKSRKK